MNRINEFGFEPGVYRHHRGALYVATDLVTHLDNATTGKMEPLPEPLVVYRDVVPVKRLVHGGERKEFHQVYARKLSEFREKFKQE